MMNNTSLEAIDRSPHADLRRRTLVRGAVWATPLISLGAPAAHAGISRCTIDNPGVIGFGPNTVSNVDAVCVGNSQSSSLNVARIRTGYGYAYLPQYIEICNCVSQQNWFRFRETDTLSNFQIEVDGRHNDQNATSAGYRPPFKLEPIGSDSGGCQQFPLTYRTSASRPFSSGASVPTASGSYDSIAFTVTLQRNASTSATAPGINDPGWTTVDTATVSGKVWRRIRNSGNTGDPINFNLCIVQSGGVTTSVPAGAQAKSQEPEAPQAATFGD